MNAKIQKRKIKELNEFVAFMAELYGNELSDQELSIRIAAYRQDNKRTNLDFLRFMYCVTNPDCLPLIERSVSGVRFPSEWILRVYVNSFAEHIDEQFCSLDSGAPVLYGEFHITRIIMELCGIETIWASSAAGVGLEEKFWKYSQTDEPILVVGETGTGKEGYSRAVHYLSRRKDQKMLRINCTGLSGKKIERLLFGHVKGAFSGVVSEGRGLLETVGRGTLFINEIADMPLSTQAKLLRALETKEYYPAGSNEGKPLRFNGRIIAGTNCDLEEAIRQKAFRSDLYYRINTIEIHLPSLVDILSSQEDRAFFVEVIDRFYRKSISEMNMFSTQERPVWDGYDVSKYCDGDFASSEAIQALLKYNYPGNYKELANIIKRAVILDERIELENLPQHVIDLYYESTGNSEKPEDIWGNIDLDNIHLKNIVEYADSIKSLIICKKIEDVYKSNSEIKEILKSEGVAGDQEYQSFTQKINRALPGNITILDIKKQYRRDNVT